MRAIYGSYAGNSTDNRQVAVTLGGTLKVLFVERVGAGQVQRTDQGGDLTFGQAIAATGAAGLIKSLDADGFTLGTNTAVNATGQTYYYWGLVDTGDDDIVTGSYTGNATDNRNITASLNGASPEVVFAWGNSAQFPWRTADMTGDFHVRWASDGGAGAANGIQAFGADSFQVGTGSGVNASGVAYYFCAFTAPAGVVATVSYVGDGTDDRSISGTGFEPHVVMAQRAGNFTNYYRVSGMSTSLYPINGGTSADAFQAFESDGFQVGTVVNVSGNTFYALCVRSLPPITTVEMDALASSLAFGEPAVTLGALSVAMDALASGLVFGEPTVATTLARVTSGTTTGGPPSYTVTGGPATHTTQLYGV